MLRCNSETKCSDPNLPLLYRELLQYFHEVTSIYGSNQERKNFLWNNKEITIEGKTLFCKEWFKKGIYLLVQGLLDNDGKFLLLFLVI